MRVRPAQPSDIAFILELEARPDYAELILTWDAAQHREAFDDPDFHYVIGENADGAQGYVILRGATNPHRSVELKRVAVAEAGAGLGPPLLKGAIREAFDRMSAHRLWLDVFPENERAQRAYRALGFQEEGVQREACWLGGRFRSLIVMSMLDSEYRAARDAGRL